jgi:tellurite resistance protein TehA-like permease
VSPGKQWLALAGQLAAGVVGGAAVWLGFNWLWVNIPAAALVAALLVVVALVWIVRKIRRAEDLQTTVLAVLVGLVVTVSPAALLLVGR